MDRIFTILGIVGVVAGFCTFAAQVIVYLIKGLWYTHSLLYIVDKLPDALRSMIITQPSLTHYIDLCPLSVGFLVLGLILLYLGAKIRNHFA
ncbi:MAG: hypothetical protein JW920_11235 [Deltaproteobacteria bacterium]|nr:hypothetical protein [Deltaproteobacteria bacterium]